MHDTDTALTQEVQQNLQLAMQHHQANELFDADLHYARVLQLQPGHAQALRLRGILARDAGDIGKSVALLTAAAEQPDATAQPLAELALTFMLAGDLQAAQNWLRRARTQEPEALDVLTNLGALLQHRGHVLEAIDIYREILAQDPEEAEVHGNLIKSLADAGQIDAALQEADAAVTATQGTRGTLAAKGVVLVDAERYTEAAATLQAALQIAPDDDMARVNLALCQTALQQLAAATTSLQDAVNANPHNARAVADLINCFSAAGEDAQALTLAEQFLQAHPAERLVVGSYALALRNAGQAAQADTLTHAAELVQVIDLPSAAGFESVADLNQALRQQLLADPSLLQDPVSKATTGGTQTGELDLAATTAMHSFAQAINSALPDIVQRYRDNGFNNHPVLQPASTHWHLRSWGTILRTGGQQSPHMHPLGWLSAVYYVAVPAEISAGDAAAGWLEFGQPPERLHCVTGPPVQRIEPRAGRLVVFPSYFWHRTLPFGEPTGANNDARISIAFDVIPAEQLRPI
jgi:tetratricopeptide (TPR) repeat protein